MSLRINIPKQIVELLKYKYNLKEEDLKKELIRLVYDLVIGERKSILWKEIGGQEFSQSMPKAEIIPASNMTQADQKSDKDRQKQDKYDTDSLIYRAKKYRDKIIQGQGYITEGQLEKVAKKFGLSIHDLMDDLIMKEPGKYYPLKG